VASPGGSRGHLGAASLTLHSFLDGLAIGLAFKVSTKVGVPVAVAVLAHDFSDGINTVNISLVGGIREKGTRRWLIADALAPLVGVGAGSALTVSPGQFSWILALFAGFFLYIGWSELSPESYHRHPKVWTTFSTVLGAVLMYLVIRVSG
jgi:zinc transporter ZupT